MMRQMTMAHIQLELLVKRPRAELWWAISKTMLSQNKHSQPYKLDEYFSNVRDVEDTFR